MKAAVYKGNKRFEIEDIPTPEPGPGQVLLKVSYCGICGTDVHAFFYDRVAPGTVMGHEYCGTIAKIGPGVSGWKEGDRILGGGGMPPPGKGPAVRDPRYSFHTDLYGDKPLNAYAEYVLMEDWQPLAIPDDVTDEAAALCEPSTTGVRAIRQSQLKLGDTVAIIGAGPIGLLCLQSVKAAGAGAVFVSEPATVRREAALALGADAVIDPSREDVVERMIELTGGLGPHVVFECAAAKPTLDQSLSMTRMGGEVVLVALAWEPVSVLPVDWVARQVKLQASAGVTYVDWEIALNLIRTGKIRTEPLVSEDDLVPLDDIQRAFESLATPTTQLQVVVKP